MQRQGEIIAPNRTGSLHDRPGLELTKQTGSVRPIDLSPPRYSVVGMERLFLLWSGYHEGFPPPEGVNDMPFDRIGSRAACGRDRHGYEKTRDDDCVVNFGDAPCPVGRQRGIQLRHGRSSPSHLRMRNNGGDLHRPATVRTDHSWPRSGFRAVSIRGRRQHILGMIAAMRGPQASP